LIKNASEYYEERLAFQIPVANTGGCVNPVTDSNTIEGERQAVAELIGRILAAYWLKPRTQGRPEYPIPDDQLPNDK
jgi:hypothetical protein